MAQPQVTADDVFAAIAEFDELGRDRFLERYSAYGFQAARSYFVNLGGRFYDSKVLLAAALLHGGRDTVTSKDFSGGDQGAAIVLRGLGFVVTDPNPDWTEDEIILACDLVAQHDWHYLDEKDPEVIELSELLQVLSQHPSERRAPTFRNPSGVARKTVDIATQHPNSTGKATRGNQLDRVMLERFLADLAGMTAMAKAIRMTAVEPRATLPVPDLDLGLAAFEGRVLERVTLRRERDQRLRQRKIDAVLSANAPIACDVCAFDFEATYGEWGHRYIEVHHRTPLHVSGPTRTRPDDLALLCSNCHRMIHHRSPWLTVEQLRARFDRAASTA